MVDMSNNGHVTNVGPFVHNGTNLICVIKQKMKQKGSISIIVIKKAC